MILIIGIPNSGKTTYSENFEKVIHYDNFKLTTLDRHIQILTLIKNNDNICIEGVYEDSKRRKDLIREAKFKNEKTICIWLNTPVEECIRRELENPRHLLSSIKYFSQIFEPPTYKEGWDEIIEIKGEK